MWSFEIIPAPAAQVVRPRVAKESPLRKNRCRMSCNCTSPSLSCLVSLTENVAESPSVSKDERPASCDDSTEYFTQIFSVKGSYWEGRYQEGLLKCMELKAGEENAAWRVIGYCGVDKIPKLTKAIRRGEIISFKLTYVRRKWISKIRAYQCYAVSITKRDRWNSELNL